MTFFDKLEIRIKIKLRNNGKFEKRTLLKFWY